MELLSKFLSFAKFDITKEQGVISALLLPIVLVFASLNLTFGESGYKLKNEISKEEMINLISEYKAKINSFPGEPIYKCKKIYNGNAERTIFLKALHSKNQEKGYLSLLFFYVSILCFVAFLAICMLIHYKEELKYKPFGQKMVKLLSYGAYTIIIIFFVIHFDLIDVKLVSLW